MPRAAGVRKRRGLFGEDEDPARPQTRAEYLVLVAENDDKQDPTIKEKLKAALDAAKRPNKVEVYPADHGWCVKGSQVYEEAEAERAWAELLALYKRALA